MQTHPQTITSHPPRVFNYSLDWRFLLPMADLSKGCLLFEDEIDFAQTLEHAGIQVSQRLFVSDIGNLKNDSLPFLVMPFGLPTDWVGAGHENRVKFYFSIRQLIDSGGYLLVGFNNALGRRTNPQIKYQSSTPRRITDEIKQAGFKSVKIYGAMPGLQIPEYIFELEPQTIRFALQNRFRRKTKVLRALRVLAGTIGWKRISYFLPCYFALATA